MAIELKEPQLFKFANQGDSFFGTLEEINDVNIHGKLATQFLLQECVCSFDGRGEPVDVEATQKMIVINATEDLKKKIRKQQLGKLLGIQFVGMEKIDGISQPMKRFKVLAF